MRLQGSPQEAFWLRSKYSLSCPGGGYPYPVWRWRGSPDLAVDTPCPGQGVPISWGYPVLARRWSGSSDLASSTPPPISPPLGITLDRTSDRTWGSSLQKGPGTRDWGNPSRQRTWDQRTRDFPPFVN